MRALTAATLALTLLSAAAVAAEKPTACAETRYDWWAKQIALFHMTDGQQGVILERSIPEIGLAYVRWSDGVEQVVHVVPHKGRACAMERLTVKR